MFANPIDAMVYSLTTSKMLMHRMIDDLKPGEWEVQPIPGGNTIAWILGHLTMTDRRHLTWLGATDLPAIPEGFAERFPTTRAPAGKQTGLGEPRALVALFDAHRDRLIAALPTVDASKWSNPPSFQTPMFRDVGEATLFMGLHTSFHIGQISLIRRHLGYPPVV